MPTLTPRCVLDWFYSECGEKYDEYMLLLALIAFAAVVILLVLGPQVVMVYAQAGISKGS